MKIIHVKNICYLLLLFVCLFDAFPLKAQVYTQTEYGIVYCIDTYDKTARVEGVKVKSIINADIKSNVAGYEVVSIEEGAFKGCSSLTSVNIPNTITNIGASAFYGCSSLTSINIPESVTEIEESAFEGCSSLTSINIPESVTEIGTRAFAFCSSLTSINISESVTEIGMSAFRGCSSLTSINLPNSVKSIDDNAFQGCIYNHRTTKTNQKYPSVNL